MAQHSYYNLNKAFRLIQNQVAALKKEFGTSEQVNIIVLLTYHILYLWHFFVEIPTNDYYHHLKKLQLQCPVEKNIINLLNLLAYWSTSFNLHREQSDR